MAITLQSGHAVLDNGSNPVSSTSINGRTTSAGDLITCEVSFSGGTTFKSLSDNINGNYTAAITAHLNSTINQYFGIYYFQNSGASSGGLNINFQTNAAASFTALSCQIWSGAATTSALDTSFTQQQDLTTTANPTTGTSKTPSNINELIIGYLGTLNNTPTAGTNFALIDTATTTFAWPEYWIQTTATATNAPYTLASDDWTDQMVAFFPLGEGPPTFAPDEDYWSGIKVTPPETIISVF